MVDKDFRHYEDGNDNRDNHRVVLINGVDAFEISLCEGYGRKTSWQLYVDTVDIKVFDGVDMMLL